MDRIIIVNVGAQSLTCEDVSQNGLPLMDKPVLIKPHEEKVVLNGNESNSVSIKIGVGYHPTWDEKEKEGRSTTLKPRLER
jgi:hypothetical protein